MIPELPPRCAVYGAGSFGRELADDLTARGTEVVGFLDRKATGAVNGLPVIHPDEVERPEQLTVVIGVFNTGVDPRPIKAELLARGFRSVLEPVPVRLALAAEGFERSNYWLSGPSDQYEVASTEIRAARDLLNDDRSREIFDALLEYRQSGDFADCLTPGDIDEQYNPDDVPFINGPVRLVDCGACDGDTIRAFERRGVQLESVVALEPDPENFDKLAATAQTAAVSAYLLPLGVYSSNCQLRFSPSGAAGVITSDGEIVVQCVSLDGLLNNVSVTHVKMDIEGAEIEALKGMKELGSSQGVRLALSIYHAPEHLWEIPLLVESQWPGRQMHIRQHGNQGFDTVLYVMES